jgi:tRNA threonylcarbamoyladenosine biosynthesis protein TsaE
MDITKIFGIDQIDEVVDMLYQLRSQCQVYALSGPLGAGKTTVSQRLLRRFGIEGVITSPTFTYMNIYQSVDGKILYHFDLYRIISVDEFILNGFNEYLYQPNSWALIEWPEVIAPLLEHKVCDIQLLYQDEGTREIKVKLID